MQGAHKGGHRKIGAYLSEQGGITSEQLNHALKVSKERKQRLGASLIELGYITLGQLASSLSLQTKDSGGQRKRIGDILIESNLITKEQLLQALTAQKEKKQKLGETLIGLGYVKRDQVTEALAEKLHLPLVSHTEYTLTDELKAIIPKEFAQKNLVIPVEKVQDQLILAMADPLDYGVIDEITFKSKLKVLPVISYDWSIKKAIEESYADAEKDESLMMSFAESVTADKDIQFKEEKSADEISINVEALQSKSKAPTVVKLVASIVAEASKLKVSDIHIEPREKYAQVRFRIDGEMRNMIRYPRDLHDSVVSRIKITSKLDITNRRTPQDGGSRVILHDKEIDLRISTLPAIHGEKVVIRLLDHSAGIVPIVDLGMPEKVVTAVSAVFKRPQGMLIVTGPTGSGKTTTLYSCLNQLKSDTKNVITIEDPVEYKLEDITQVQVNEAVGRTFVSVLRSVLRQDPDVVMVGEVRDLQTAEIAVKAALTGHLVLTTLHTNSTVATITRLIDIGIPTYLVNSAVSGIIAQRLIRRICVYCRVKEPVNDAVAETIEALGLPMIKEHYYGKGCQKCSNMGYAGRIAVYEFLGMSPEFRKTLARTTDENELIVAAKQSGVDFLIEDAWAKVANGITTIDEVLAKIPVEYRLKSISKNLIEEPDIAILN